MQRGCYSLVVVTAVLALPGCALWKEQKQPATYETVAANPTYDTAEAEKQHAKALKILNGCSCFNSVLALLSSEETLLKAQVEELALAEGHLQKALIADVTYGPAHNTLGLVYTIQRKFYLAAWEFDYAAKLMPEQVEPLYNLGLLYEVSDKLDSAIECYEQALALAPRDPLVLGSLTSVRMKNGQSVDELRPMLEAIVFGDNRPEWIEWARDLLGTNPIPMVAETLPANHAVPATPPSPTKPALKNFLPKNLDSGPLETAPVPPLPDPALQQPLEDGAPVLPPEEAPDTAAGKAKL